MGHHGVNRISLQLRQIEANRAGFPLAADDGLLRNIQACIRRVHTVLRFLKGMGADQAIGNVGIHFLVADVGTGVGKADRAVCYFSFVLRNICDRIAFIHLYGMRLSVRP